jgi:hypothetical protein
MRRFTAFLSLSFLLVVAAILAATANSAPSTASTDSDPPPGSFAPAVDCTLTPSRSASPAAARWGASRPFS